jgi:outer membrane protein, adhesin transport system
MRLTRKPSRQLEKSALFLTVIPILTLAGCGERPQDIAGMSSAIGAALTLDAADTSEAAQPVSLQSGFRGAIAEAVQASPAYGAALALEREAFSNIGVASSARLPQLGVNANLGGIRAGDAEPETGVASNLSISQMLYDGGESAATVNRATAQALATQAERRVRGNEIALEAARAWIDVWQYGQRLDLLQARTAEMNSVTSQIERMASTGMIDRTALDSARRQIVDVSLEEVRLQTGLQEAQLRFDRYFNLPGARPSRPDEVVTQQDALRLAQQWQEAPLLQRSAAELIVARNSAIIAQAGFQPRARLEAGVRSPLEQGESVNSSVGLSLTYTLGDGGRRQASLRGAEERLEAAQAQLSEAQRSLNAELEGAVTRLQAIERSMALVAENIRLSTSEAETVRSQIVTGQSNLRQLIEAEIAAYRAQDQQIAMQAEKLTLQLVIAASTGALGDLIGLELAAAE